MLNQLNAEQIKDFELNFRLMVRTINETMATEKRNTEALEKLMVERLTPFCKSLAENKSSSSIMEIFNSKKRKKAKLILTDIEKATLVIRNEMSRAKTGYRAQSLKFERMMNKLVAQQYVISRDDRKEFIEIIRGYNTSSEAIANYVEFIKNKLESFENKKIFDGLTAQEKNQLRIIQGFVSSNELQWIEEMRQHAKNYGEVEGHVSQKPNIEIDFGRKLSEKDLTIDESVTKIADLAIQSSAQRMTRLPMLMKELHKITNNLNVYKKAENAPQEVEFEGTKYNTAQINFEELNSMAISMFSIAKQNAQNYTINGGKVPLPSDVSEKIIPPALSEFNRKEHDVQFVDEKGKEEEEIVVERDEQEERREILWQLGAVSVLRDQNGDLFQSNGEGSEAAAKRALR